MRPIGETVDEETMRKLVETPDLLGCVSNREMRTINKNVLCNQSQADDIDMFRDLTEAQVSYLTQLLHETYPCHHTRHIKLLFNTKTIQ